MLSICVLRFQVMNMFVRLQTIESPSPSPSQRLAHPCFPLAAPHLILVFITFRMKKFFRSRCRIPLPLAHSRKSLQWAAWHIARLQLLLIEILSVTLYFIILGIVKELALVFSPCTELVGQNGG